MAYNNSSTSGQKQEWLSQCKDAFQKASVEQLPGLLLHVARAMQAAGLYSQKTGDWDICYNVAKRIKAMGWTTAYKFGVNKISEIRELSVEEIKALMPEPLRVPPPPVSPAKRPRIVCLCGSSRFIVQIAVKAWDFESRGIMAVGMHLLPQDFPAHHAAEAMGVAAVLDELHLRKIDLCDFVYVMNVDGYIGERTRLEIEYAQSLGKPIQYLLESSVPSVVTVDNQDLIPRQS